MNVLVSEQLEHLQRDLARNLAEVQRIAESLADLSQRLKREPWKWSVDPIDDTIPDSNGTQAFEPELVDALDRHRLAWLLEDIRMLRRRATELKRLVAA
jgi:hypothetical protein